MAKMDPKQNAYYPSKAKTKDLHDDFRLLFSHVYKLQRQVADLHGKLAATQPPSSQSNLGGPSTTKIAGLNVHATPPQNGQKLTYNAATGEIEWQ